jgi:hypothetical protein
VDGISLIQSFKPVFCLNTPGPRAPHGRRKAEILTARVTPPFSEN